MPTYPATPTVFTVDGDVTGPEAAHLSERLWPHLLDAPTSTILDLRTSGSLDDAGVDLIAAVHTYAQHRGLEFSTTNVAPQLHQVLLAAGVPASDPVTVPEPA